MHALPEPNFLRSGYISNPVPLFHHTISRNPNKQLIIQITEEGLCMSCEGGGGYGYGSNVGIVLVLFILLVIILSTFYI